MRVWLSGASGFVGSHLLREILATTDWEVVAPVGFAHCGDPFRISMALEDYPTERSRVHVVPTDLSLPQTEYTKKRFGRCDMILHVASGSHVDTSIEHPVDFVRNNMMLQTTALELAREWDVKLFLQMSTDEVHGSAPSGVYYDEWSPHRPGNVYAATKSGQEALVQAYWRTWGVPAIITRTMNLISPYAQDPGKFVPKAIKAINTGEKLFIHGTPDRSQSGTRHWIDARDWAEGWMFIINNLTPSLFGKSEELDIYHLVGDERSNLEIALRLARLMGKPLNYEIVDFHSSRPGHDVAYRMTDTKLHRLGWTPSRFIDTTLADILEWAKLNPGWYS